VETARAASGEVERVSERVSSATTRAVFNLHLFSVAFTEHPSNIHDVTTLPAARVHSLITASYQSDTRIPTDRQHPPIADNTFPYNLRTREMRI
jgi:hypothetical protein